MEFLRGPMILPTSQGGSPVKVAVGKQGDPTTFTAGEDHDGSGCILIIKGSAGNEKMHGVIDAGISFMNLRADDKITPQKIADVIVGNFPSANTLHLDAYVNALAQYEAAKPDGITVAEGLSVGLALLPAVSNLIPKNKVTDSIRTVLSSFGVKF